MPGSDAVIRYLYAAVLALTVIPLVTGPTGAARAQETATAVFAGGCFWCVESDFDAVPGVTETISGYTGGTVPNPTYEQVSHGNTGHYEAVEITYDPAKVTYAELLTAFWHSVDPTDAGGQFCDRGHSYKTAIWVKTEAERQAAEASKAAAEKELGAKIVTPILDATPFFSAEGYHQNYYQTNPVRYRYYRWGCGRNQRIEELWGDAAYKGIAKH
jgi:peptide-methionine (S)-S-oxide reductase